MNEKWYRMEDVRRHSYDTSAWVPVRASREISEGGDYGTVGYREKYFGSVGILFSVTDREGAMEAEWINANRHRNAPRLQDGRFVGAKHFNIFGSDVSGEILVLRQSFKTSAPQEWHLDQDFALSLGLRRTDDVWVCPKEGDREVARLHRNEENDPVLLEVRNEHLKDYLCARNAGLLLVQFHERIGIETNAQAVTWSVGDRKKEDIPGGQWEGRAQTTTSSGLPGGGITIQKVSRTDVDYNEDVPRFDPSEEGVYQSETQKFISQEDSLIRISGELWKNDWITPGGASPRVLNDEVDTGLPFITGADGSMTQSDELTSGIEWLWFRPTVANALLENPSGRLDWYTEDTGSIGTVRGRVHFGINDIGLLNVLAKDVADLPSPAQKVWVAHNCTPEGGVSKELLMAQMEAQPAHTEAPEMSFRKHLRHLESQSKELFGASLLRDHFKEEEILAHVSRFRAIDEAGLYQLAKEITRLVVERLNEKLLREQLPDADDKLGTIKLLEQFLTNIGADGYGITGPLVGAYDLRHADAHLPSSDLSEELELLNISETPHPILKGKSMISTVTEALRETCATLDDLTPNDVARVAE